MKETPKMTPGTVLSHDNLVDWHSNTQLFEDLDINIDDDKLKMVLESLDIDGVDSIDEGILGALAGALTGATLGKSVGKIIAKVLGVEKGVLYDLLTSRIVAAAMGAEMGKKLF